jgi:hypothetical protein
MRQDKYKLAHRSGMLCLAASLLVLLFGGPIAERLGVGMFVLWVALGGAGVYLMSMGRGWDKLE